MTIEDPNNSLDPNLIKIETLSKSFQYEKMARELDECDDPDDLRTAAKCFLKLYLKTTETIKHL